MGPCARSFSVICCFLSFVVGCTQDGILPPGADPTIAGEGPAWPGTCSDGIDNDGDGYIDCEDLGCASASECIPPDDLTIADIKDPASRWFVAPGGNVRLARVIVTASRDRMTQDGRVWDAFVQDPEGGPYSATLVAFAEIPLEAGDAVEVHGEVQDYFGMGRVRVDTVNILEQGMSLPAPKVLPASSIATEGDQRLAYQAALVAVQDVTVTEAVVLIDEQDRGDFQVSGGLLVGSLFQHAYRTQRTAGDQFSSIIGVLDYSFEQSRLQPRDNRDLTFADGSSVSLPLATVPQLQNRAHAQAIAENSEIRVESVVITAMSVPDSSGRVHFFVGEAAGGPYSGIYIYNRDNVSLGGAAVGSLVDLQGRYTEFAFSGDSATVAQIVLSDLEVRGTGAVPAPHHTTAALLAERATAEPWEGVLVEVTDVEVSHPTNQYGEFRLQGGLKVSDLLLGGTMPMADAGDYFEIIRGPLHHNFGYAIVPGALADLLEGTPPPPPSVTIAQIQDREHPDAVAENTVVRLESVVVTALTAPDNSGRTHLYVGETSGGPYSGIYIHNQADLDVSTVTVGALVDLQGTYKEFSVGGDTATISQLYLESVEVVGTGELPSVQTLSAQDLAHASTAEPWEGVLVRAEGLTAQGAQNNYGEVLVDADLKISNAIAKSSFPEVVADDYFLYVEGPLHYTFGYMVVATTWLMGEPPGSDIPIVSVAQLRDRDHEDAIDEGTLVRLEGVVVTGVTQPDGQGRIHFFVSTPEGGEFSGIYIYNASDLDVAVATIGAEVNLEGTYVEFVWGGDSASNSQIYLSHLEYEGEGTLPPAQVLPIAELDSSDAARPWLGVLVEVQNVTVTEGTNQHGTFALAPSLRVASLLTPVPQVDAGATFVRIRGLVQHFLQTRIHPRDGDDLLDVDVAWTIPMLQNPEHEDFPALGTEVSLSDVVVTGVKTSTEGMLEGFAVQQTGTPVPFSGIWVAVASEATVDAVAVGDVVSVVGVTDEVNGRNQILGSHAAVTGSHEVPAPVLLNDPHSFNEPTNIRPYLGMLVTVQKDEGKLVVDGAPNAPSNGFFRLDGDAMRVDANIFRYDATVNEEFTSITGIVNLFGATNQTYRLSPRRAEDLVP